VQLLDDGVLAHPSVGARDPLKLIVDVSATLADGIAVDRSLNERGIRLEGADRRTLVPLLTIGDDEARVRHLATALAEAIDENRGGLREAPRVARLDAAVQLALAHHAGLVEPALQPARERTRDRVQVSHRVVISTMRSSRVSTGAGSTRPSHTSASAHAARGTRPQRPVSPVATPSGGAP